MGWRSLAVLVGCVAISVPSPAAADNTTPTGAYSLMPGGTAAEGFVNDSSPYRWYWFRTVAGRSYCAETQGGVLLDTSATAGNLDPDLTVYKSDYQTEIASNDDALAEPLGGSLPRVCWIPTVSENTYIRVGRGAATPSAAFAFRVRVVDTTLFCPWFYVSDNPTYETYVVLRNTTNTPVSFSKSWRDFSGNLITGSGGIQTLPANGSTYGARYYTPAVPVNFGTIEIVHDGPPGAIVANATVISVATGLSFDVPFFTRPTW
jgi:hypothetical protein